MTIIYARGEGRIDLVVGGKLLVELKAVEALAPTELTSPDADV